MKSPILPLALFAVAALVINAVARPVQTVSSMHADYMSPGCANIWDSEPIVIYNVQGSTFLEQVHSTLIVYSSGSVMYVNSTSSSSLRSGAQETSFSVDPRAARQLQMDLAAAGAFGACDGVAAGADIPLTTVTVFSGSTDALAHSFSFFDNLADPVYGEVQDILGEFIATL
jgi:hypothetical protein